MNEFKDPQITYNDQPNGRFVTINLNHMGLPNARVTFIDTERPDETNAQERTRVLGLAKQLFRRAAESL